MRLPVKRVPPPQAALWAAALAAVAAFGAVLAAVGGGGRWLELLVAAALVAAIRTGAAPRVPAALAAAAGYLAVEEAYGRLGHDRYWLHVAALGLLALVAAAADAARRADEEAAAALARAEAAATDARRRAELERELAQGRAVQGLDRELVRSRRHDHETSLLLVRPDAPGDLLLEDGSVQPTLLAVARAIGRSIRSTDEALVRDDTFEVLLPETPAEGARVAAERIRLGVTADAEGGTVTVSIGAATFPLDGDATETLRGAALEGLEHAVAAGGNRTVLRTAPAAAPSGWGLRRIST